MRKLTLGTGTKRLGLSCLCAAGLSKIPHLKLLFGGDRTVPSRQLSTGQWRRRLSPSVCEHARHSIGLARGPSSGRQPARSDGLGLGLVLPRRGGGRVRDREPRSISRLSIPSRDYRQHQRDKGSSSGLPCKLRLEHLPICFEPSATEVVRMMLMYDDGDDYDDD